MQAAFDGAGVAGEALGAGDGGSGRADLVDGLLVQTHDAHHLQEVVHAERRGVGGAAPGGHDVAGPGGVVADRLDGVLADEDAAGVRHVLHRVGGDREVEAEVLGRELVREVDCFGDALGEDDAAAGFEALAGDGGAVEGREAFVDGLRDGFGEISGVREEDGGGELVVLGAGEEVGGDEGGIGVGVGDDEGLGGAEDAVDADFAEELLLGEGDEDAAGAADLVDARDGLGAVGHRGDALHAAGAEDVIDAGDFGGDELERGDGAIGRDGRGHDDLGDAGDAGGDDGHEDGGRVDGGGAGDVEAGAGDRADDLADRTVLEGLERVGELLFVEGADAVRSDGQGFDKRCIDLGSRLADLVAGDFEGQLGGVGGDAVDRFVVAADSGVAVLADVAEDAVDDLRRRRARRRRRGG